METVISFTPAQLWGWILALCGGVVTIAAAAGIIIKAVHAAKQPNAEQNKRLDDLEEWRKIVDRKLDNDKDHFEAIEAGNRVTQRALLALLDHGLDGNNVDQMKRAKNDLQNHLIER